MTPLHAQSISSAYEKVIALALIANAVLFAVYVMLPHAHGKVPIEEARSGEVGHMEPVAVAPEDADLQPEARTRVIETAFGPTVEFRPCCATGPR